MVYTLWRVGPGSLQTLICKLKGNLYRHECTRFTESSNQIV